MLKSEAKAGSAKAASAMASPPPKRYRVLRNAGSFGIPALEERVIEAAADGTLPPEAIDPEEVPPETALSDWTPTRASQAVAAPAPDAGPAPAAFVWPEAATQQVAISTASYTPGDRYRLRRNLGTFGDARSTEESVVAAAGDGTLPGLPSEVIDPEPVDIATPLSDWTPASQRVV